MATTSPTLPRQVTPPVFVLSDAAPGALDGQVIALPVWADDDALIIGPGADGIDADLLGLLDLEGATGKAGEVTAYPLLGDGPTRRILLVGVGDQSRTAFRRAGAALARAVRDVESVATSIPALEPETALEPFVAGLVLGSFGFNWRSAGPGWEAVRSVTLAELGPVYAAALERAEAMARASWLARFLATVPSNLKSPQWLAEQAVAVAEEAGLKAAVWDESALEAEGFGGILGVGSGSATPPRMVRLDYTPTKHTRSTPTIALVGKGITFDTGGLTIKPAEGMTTMKRDMTGAAVVLATMSALAAVDCPVKVVGLLPMAENAISGSAMRPGDVLRHYGGRTSEVTNTDAEGRLVLADAMAYAVEKVKPDALVDVATLTGAIKVALGQQVGGLFATSDTLADAILEAGETAGEPLWRFPLAAAYEERLASKVADADNGPGGPGAITAALFLQHFSGGLPWAHLDIASVGDAPADDYEWTPGPTGFGVRALLTWLGSRDVTV